LTPIVDSMIDIPMGDGLWCECRLWSVSLRVTQYTQNTAFGKRVHAHRSLRHALPILPTLPILYDRWLEVVRNDVP
jgi:hypothetical protein